MTAIIYLWIVILIASQVHEPSTMNNYCNNYIGNCSFTIRILRSGTVKCELIYLDLMYDRNLSC